VHAADADAVIVQFAAVTTEIIRSMTKAKAIVRYGIGYDNVDGAAARARGIPLCKVPDCCIDEVADHTLAFILALTRQVVPNSMHLREGRCGLATPLNAMSSLRHLTIGIVGFGRIGREVGRRLLAFRARVLVFDPVVEAHAIGKEGAVAAASFEELLAQNDIVSPHCPSTPRTKQLFNTAAFAKMKAGALLSNVGRGDLADSEAVTAALQSGHLAGAALDLFDPEPIPVDHPIRRMPNAILASHIDSASPPRRENAARNCRTNCPPGHPERGASKHRQRRPRRNVESQHPSVPPIPARRSVFAPLSPLAAGPFFAKDLRTRAQPVRYSEPAVIALDKVLEKREF
jgi:D-3-phosphoglycerate dehydrogenase